MTAMPELNGPGNRDSSRFPYLAIAVSLCLLSPTLFLGFYADDFVHQLALQGVQPDSPMRPWALFDFGSMESWGDLDGEVASFPWWTDADWRIRFFRPVASIGIWLQFLVFGEWPAGYHITALTLHSLLLVLVYRLFLDLQLSESAAKRGTLLFGVCDSVVMPVGWIANQNSLYVALFGVASFRYCCDHNTSWRNAVLGLVFAVAALLSKESGSASVLLYCLAMFSRCRLASSQKSRMVGRFGVGASAIVLLFWAGIIVTQEYGTRSLFYATPWSEPFRFAQNLLVLTTAGVVSLCGVFPIDLVTFFPAAYVPVVFLGATLSIPLVIWIGRNTFAHGASKWLFAWTVGYSVLQAGGPPSDRLLFVPAIGFAGILSIFFEAKQKRLQQGTQGRIAKACVLALWLSASVASASSTFLQSLALTTAARFTREKATLKLVEIENIGHRDVLVLQSENQMQAFTFQPTYMYRHHTNSLTIWNLQTGNRPLRWTRIDERTFDLESTGSPFFSLTLEHVYLTSPPNVQVGDRWETKAFEVEALATRDGHPTKLRFRLTRDLGPENTIFVRSQNGIHTAVTPPSIGESIDLPSPKRAGPLMP